ncbi:MAG: single-stranded DNA-binding protein [Saprospiraceae bacterium]|nr:single-stranded DNA-binding protein [Saprospiraceae bacterium]
MVNKVILIGNLGRDPEVRRLENGAVVAKFTIATNESYKDKNGDWQDQTEWHNVVVWRNLAERAEAQLKKGMPVYIEGKLTHRSWKDQDGNDRYITEVVANYFRSLAKKESSGYFPSQADEPGSSYNDAPPPMSPMPDGGSDNDLPF